MKCMGPVCWASYGGGENPAVTSRGMSEIMVGWVGE